ncbi:membrane-spanning 4-domains subfamily A member 4A [Ictalurus punctatus]|uniref:Membrane-spanning 4-domains subfamily A member 4A n=1 Tax=Ictalurus punctatus TaxID=7998 RepID=A0A2D0S5L6_ICTPU|nr:membrane-spanning 4-domains subfamily A member 4A [Ictalurus punctatus]
MTPVTAPADTQISRRTAFLKGKPKALGTVQIMIGIMTLLFGIVLTSLTVTPAIISGITVWGSLIYISSGALSVAAGNNYNSCVVKASLGMNVFSAVVAGITLILFPVDMLYGSALTAMCQHHYYDRSYNSYNPYSSYRCAYSSVHMWNGIYGVLLVFSLLEFIISICTSAFACKVTCCSETRLIYSQPMYSQPMNSQLMNSQVMNSQVMNSQPMNSQPMNSQPMYNPAFYNPQVPQQSSVITYNNV